MISTEQPPRRTGLIVGAAATTAALFVLGVFVHQRHYNALTQMSDMTSAMTASDPLSTYYGEYLGGSNVKGPEPNATFGPAPFYQFVGESAIVGAKYSAAGAQTVADFATAGAAGGGYNPVENTAKRFSALSLTTANDYGTLAMGGSVKNPVDVYNNYNAPKEERGIVEDVLADPSHAGDILVKAQNDAMTQMSGAAAAKMPAAQTGDMSHAGDAVVAAQNDAIAQAKGAAAAKMDEQGVPSAQAADLPHAGDNIVAAENGAVAQAEAAVAAKLQA